MTISLNKQEYSRDQVTRQQGQGSCSSYKGSIDVIDILAPSPSSLTRDKS
jgi:hypothetical protein